VEARARDFSAFSWAKLGLLGIIVISITGNEAGEEASRWNSIEIGSQRALVYIFSYISSLEVYFYRQIPIRG
jgi:hypothetical protein